MTRLPQISPPKDDRSDAMLEAVRDYAERVCGRPSADVKTNPRTSRVVFIHDRRRLSHLKTLVQFRTSYILDSDPAVLNAGRKARVLSQQIYLYVYRSAVTCLFLNFSVDVMLIIRFNTMVYGHNYLQRMPGEAKPSQTERYTRGIGTPDHTEACR